MGTYKRAGNFHASGGGHTLDPRLEDILQAAAAASPYNVEAFSGVAGRSTGTKNHPGGYAIDVRLIDPQTGKVLPNYQSAKSFPAYEQFAQAARVVQQTKYPDLDNSFRWGGYFKAGVNPIDLMHFDVTPGAPGMKGGSWDNGASPETAKKWGLTSNGGLGDPRRYAQIKQQVTGSGGLVPPASVPGKAPIPATRTAQAAINTAAPAATVTPAAYAPQAHTPAATAQPATMSPALQAARARLETARAAQPKVEGKAPVRTAAIDAPLHFTPTVAPTPAMMSPTVGASRGPLSVPGYNRIASIDPSASPRIAGVDVTPADDVPPGYQPRQTLDVNEGMSDVPDFTARNDAVKQQVAANLAPSAKPHPSSANTMSWTTNVPSLHHPGPQAPQPGPAVNGLSPPSGAFNSLHQFARAVSPMMMVMGTSQPSNFMRINGPGFFVAPSSPQSQNYVRVIPAAPGGLTSDGGDSVVTYQHVSPTVGENVYDPDTGWHAR